MKIVLNRDGGLSLAEQLVAQIELQILSGTLEEGGRLPSVRALARRLDIDPRTVHAAYRKLVQAGNAALTPGSGAFVVRGVRHVEAAARPPDLTETLRDILRAALRAGYSSDSIREAVRNWLESEAPARLLVADPAFETAEILVAELRGLGFPVEARDLDSLTSALGPNSVVLALPFHEDRLRRSTGDAAVVTARLAPPASHQDEILQVPAGGVILVVSHSSRVVTYAQAMLQTLRGHDVVIECHLLAERARWMRTAGIADLVLADVLALPVVRAAVATARELRLLTAETLDEVRAVMSLPVPAPCGPR